MPIFGARPAKGLTPIIGLAVVVALAMVAVFGAMSLTPSPALAEGHVENLRVTNVATGQIMLQWDGSVEDEVGDYSARWYEKSLGNSGIQFTAGSAGAPFLVIVTGEDNVVTATVGAANGETAILFDGRLYVVEVRSSTGDAAVVEATPDAIPNTGTIAISDASVDDDKPGEVDLTWSPDSDPGDDLTWQYRADTSTVEDPEAGVDTYTWVTADVEEGIWTDFPGAVTGDGSTDYEGTVTGLEAKPYRFMVRASNGDAHSTEDNTSVAFPIGTGMVNADTGASAIMPAAAPVTAIDSTIDVSGVPDPGKVDRIELMFDLEEATNTLVHDMVIDLEDFVFPSAVGTSSVVVKATGFSGKSVPDHGTYTFTPEDVDIDGTDLVLSLGDVTEDTSGGSQTGGIYEIPAGSDITVVIRSTADIATPTEAGGYAVKVTFGDDVNDIVFAKVMINRVVVLADADSGDEGLTAGRGDMATVSGKGYKNGTTVTFWRDNLVSVMWDHDNDDATDMVRLEESEKANYEMAVDPMMEHGDIMRSSLSYSFDNKYYLFPLPQYSNDDER